MCRLSAILTAALLASCTTGPDSALTGSADKQREYQRALAGKVAQPSVNCVPQQRLGDMRTIDEETIVFSNGANRLYVTHMQGGCPGIGSAHHALATHRYGSGGLCRGDIAQVVDTLSQMTVGSCVFGEFTPYVAAGS